MSDYVCFKNNPILLVDNKGDTSAVYGTILDAKTQLPSLVLLYQTFASGRNTVVVLNAAVTKNVMENMNLVKGFNKYLSDHKGDNAIQSKWESRAND